MSVVAMIWISRVKEEKVGARALTFPKPLPELRGLAEQATNNVVLSITALNSKVASVIGQKRTDYMKNSLYFWGRKDESCGKSYGSTWIALAIT
jgi:hypothetical protein